MPLITVIIVIMSAVPGLPKTNQEQVGFVQETGSWGQ